MEDIELRRSGVPLLGRIFLAVGVLNEVAGRVDDELKAAAGVEEGDAVPPCIIVQPPFVKA